MSTEIRIALVFQQDEGTQALRTALANAGVVVAVESRASDLDPTVIFASDVDAIVVNLDAELEELLDEVTDALDSASQPVIYNDPAASSDLSGWDRARWLRHLAAKLKGQTNVTPPAPPGAQAIPVPAPKTVEVSAAVAVAAPEDVAVAAEKAAPEVAADIPFDLGLADLDLMFDAPASAHAGTEAEVRSLAADAARATGESVSAPGDAMFALEMAELELMFDEPTSVAEGSAGSVESQQQAAIPEAVAAPADNASDLGLADLDAMFEMAPDTTPAQAPARPQALMLGDDIGDLDALFAEAPDSGFSGEALPAAVAKSTASVEFELESLFAEPEAPANPGAPTPTASSAELNDLDELFREFAASQSPAEAIPTPAEPKNAAEPVAASQRTEAVSSLSLDWSLAPVEEQAPAAPQGDRVVAEWRLDGPSKPITPVAAQPVAPPPAKSSSGPAIPAELEASLALSNLQLLDDLDLGEPASDSVDAAALAELESLHMSSLDLGARSEAEPGRANDLSHDLGLADLDFDLDLGGADLDTPPLEAPRTNLDADLGDLDSLFEPVAQPVSPGIALADLNRVFVLGASIGGPEAIKAFLARLPATVPAAFIIAQHMGAEFLEMMATQLDAASALAVRTPKAGERLRHGEAIVAPANEQLTIDESGQIQLSAASSGSPYNPSIDQLARDAANRFGNRATLVLFSGMGTDAVEGGRYLAARGGEVWAQDRGSCVIASMIDSAKSQGLIRFEGTPVQLAERVLQVAS
ncbi:MAG TPA: chemotaxis protein CheB [Xanthomonadales bacterium]|nr:chemotaxis protein CheB [Xanthomonadales bacterium]